MEQDDDMKTKHPYIATIGNVKFGCNSVDDAIERVKLFFQSWYRAGQVKEWHQSDWNVWSNRKTQTGHKKHIANVTATYDDCGKPIFQYE